MMIKMLIVLFLLLLVGAAWLYRSPSKREALPEKPIDEAWWYGLSEEWKTILRINQYCYRHRVDFYQVQNDYLNRLNGSEDAARTVLNTSLRDLNGQQRFVLGYADLYARVRKSYPNDAADSIDLNSLHLLDQIYMVSGPGDLTPLKKFPNLRVLVANYCGIDHAAPSSEQVLELEPLRTLKQLEHLHCATPALKSIALVKDLVNLVYLDCENSDVTSLAPLKGLSKLESLYFGPKVKDAAVVARLSRLQTLHVVGCKQMPDLSALKKLQKLCIVESELALVNKDYQIRDLSFLQNLTALEFLDFELTSYKGNLDNLKNLSKLKAITLPRVSTADMLAFRREHGDCILLNRYEWD